MSDTPPQPPQDQDKVPLVPEYQGKARKGEPHEGYRHSVFLQILGGFWGYLGILVGASYALGWIGAVLHWDSAMVFWLAPVVAFAIIALLCLLLRTPVAFVTALILFVVMLTLCSICGMMVRGL
ncbi:MAG TPA: hypothetical protein VH253_10545 [Phycisphaerae bacterium]|nr:hypothetical protein [Phycisphaerae bacterium]